MTTLILAVTSLLFYSVGTTLLALAFRGRIAFSRQTTLATGALAICSHSALSWHLISTPSGLDLSLFPAAVLIAVIMTILAWALLWRKPVQNLLLTLYPLCIATILAALTQNSPDKHIIPLQSGLLAHVALSITAYSLFGLAGIQAILLHLQNTALKQKIHQNMIRRMPPLLSMEALLFELVWMGLMLLTLAIITGAIFIEDLFAQHLVHKTIFSILSWTVFVALLIGRHTQGWRGFQASRWTLGGLTLLVLGYYGTKIVLELIQTH